MSFQADSPTSKNVEASLYFNIERQPLIAALREYSEVTGQAVMVDDALTVGRKSLGAQGNFNKINALTTLLIGTGLTARYASDQAFTLHLLDDDHSRLDSVLLTAKNIPDQSSDDVSERYAGEIQEPIQAALCQSETTRPGTYRLALQIWISSYGKVEKTQLLHATQSTVTRDIEVIRLMNKLLLDPPPVELSQPITLLFLPDLGADISVCSAPPHSKRGQ